MHVKCTGMEVAYPHPPAYKPSTPLSDTHPGPGLVLSCFNPVCYVDKYISQYEYMLVSSLLALKNL